MTASDPKRTLAFTHHRPDAGIQFDGWLGSRFRGNDEIKTVRFRPIAVIRLRCHSAIVRQTAALAVLAALTALNGCTPEGFDVDPCSLNGQLAFRIHEINGWFTDYQPRPTSVTVLEEGKPPASAAWPRMWGAELKYYGERDTGYDKRAARKLIVYGQRLQKWEVDQPARPLTNGKKYWIVVHDGGRSGSASFMGGQRGKACS